MKRVLIAVLSASVPPYPELMAAQMETWDSVPVEGVETVFYSSKMQQAHPKLVCFDIKEAYNTIGRKDLLAYAWALENRDWDYMARVNASCYVRKQKLSKYVQALPAENLFCGVGCSKTSGECSWLWGGAQYVISRDVIQKIVANGNLWNHSEMEDVAMSHLVKRLGIPYDTNGRCCSINRRKEGGWLCISYGSGVHGGFNFQNMAEMAAATDQHFIRVKQDGERHVDIEIMRELHKNGI